jgi:glycosyltransferase involved in cell wall biosynthesis
MPPDANKPLRILNVLPSLNPADGGPPESVRTLTQAYTAQGHLCEVATLDDPRADWLTGLPCPVIALGPGILGKYGLSGAFRRWMRDNVRRFDIVVINGIYQYHSVATRAACLKAGIPYVAFTHGALDPWFRRRYPLKQIKKWLYWPWADYRVLRDADRILFTTDEERDLAPQSFWLYRVRPAVVGYGTAYPPPPDPEDDAELQSAFPALNGRRFLLFLSRIDRKKGCELLIEAFAKTSTQDPELLLVMAGPDTSGWKNELESLARKLQISNRIVWVGSLRGKQKWAAFRRAEAFVLTSHAENFGIVVVEALACGTPVLISERVNIWRDVVRGGGGFAATDTVEGSVDLLTKWNSLPIEAKTKMREAAKVTFRESFDISAIATRILAECRSVIEEKGTLSKDSRASARHTSI